jgi:hypothetical protein
MMPAQYISNSIDNFNIIGFGDYDYESKFDNIYEPEIMTT